MQVADQVNNAAPIVMGLLASALLGVRTVAHHAERELRCRTEVSQANYLFEGPGAAAAEADDTDAQDNQEF